MYQTLTHSLVGSSSSNLAHAIFVWLRTDFNGLRLGNDGVSVILKSTDFAWPLVVTARLIIFAVTRTSCQDRNAPANFPPASSGHLERCQCNGDVTIRNNCPRTHGLIKSNLFRAVL